MCVCFDAIIFVHVIMRHVLIFQALSGVGESIQIRARILDNTALTTSMSTQFLFQIGLFTAVPMILGFILEQGFLRVNTCFLVYKYSFYSLYLLLLLSSKCKIALVNALWFNQYQWYMLFNMGVGIRKFLFSSLEQLHIFLFYASLFVMENFPCYLSHFLFVHCCRL